LDPQFLLALKAEMPLMDAFYHPKGDSVSETVVLSLEPDRFPSFGIPADGAPQGYLDSCLTAQALSTELTSDFRTHDLEF
jgi:hypothetical protein